MSNDDCPQSKAQEVIESLWQPYLSVGLYKGNRQRAGWCVGNNVSLSSVARICIEPSATFTAISRVIHQTLQKNPEAVRINGKQRLLKYFLIFKLPHFLPLELQSVVK